MSCTDNKDGSCTVEYVPSEPGTYSLNITYGGQPIKGDRWEELSGNICIHHVYLMWLQFCVNIRRLSPTQTHVKSCLSMGIHRLLL